MKGEGMYPRIGLLNWIAVLTIATAACERADECVGADCQAANGGAEPAQGGMSANGGSAMVPGPDSAVPLDDGPGGAMGANPEGGSMMAPAPDPGGMMMPGGSMPPATGLLCDGIDAPAEQLVHVCNEVELCMRNTDYCPHAPPPLVDELTHECERELRSTPEQLEAFCNDVRDCQGMLTRFQEVLREVAMCFEPQPSGANYTCLDRITLPVLRPGGTHDIEFDVINERGTSISLGDCGVRQPAAGLELSSGGGGEFTFSLVHPNSELDYVMGIFGGECGTADARQQACNDDAPEPNASRLPSITMDVLADAAFTIVVAPYSEELAVDRLLLRVTRQ